MLSSAPQSLLRSGSRGAPPEGASCNQASLPRPAALHSRRPCVRRSPGAFAPQATDTLMGKPVLLSPYPRSGSRPGLTACSSHQVRARSLQASSSVGFTGFITLILGPCGEAAGVATKAPCSLLYNIQARGSQNCGSASLAATNGFG
ncbi:hypothetical protein HJG60_010209 [Phyllostomus discolor]|uniref:Uncharacterized protein n=1 Tax=Phyllostomus discolor TaxID=89673 RepID=A0A834ASM3_9CHIR|nr:hypothetical protein HJG60_010209 [Phyllostomus discolor]